MDMFKKSLYNKKKGVCPKYLNKVVNGLKVEKIIVRYVDTNAKVEASVSKFS